jgi:serine/threonine-protein kinase RsbW
MADGGYDEDDIFGMRIALEEAIGNALKHGHHFDPNKRVAVGYQVSRHCVLARVADEGPGFDPSCLADPSDPAVLERTSGRGILLIGAFTSWARYNRTGNCLVLCKLPANPGQAAAKRRANE